jgi:predicted nucleic acid-binding protein
MRRVFADTYYWIAPLNDKDQGHAAAQAISQSLGQATIITTQEVLAEVLTHFSGYGRFMRQSAAAFIRNILADPAITVREQSAPSFLSGLALYETRLDKAYSLADCISMQTMRQAGLTEILTHDDHFTQEGFITLL